MTWLERRKKLQQHAAFIEWCQQEHLPTHVLHQRPISGPPQPVTHYLKMTQNPTLRAVSFEDIGCIYSAVNFQDLLGDFIAKLRDPHISDRSLHDCGVNTWILFHHVPIFHKIKFMDSDGAIVDSAHIRPEQLDTHGRIIPACFDTVLLRTGQQPDNVHGMFLSDHLESGSS